MCHYIPEMGLCVMGMCVRVRASARFLELAAISGSLQSPPPYVNKHDRSHRLYQRGRWGGWSGWERGGGGRRGVRAACACGRLAAGGRRARVREGARGGAGGASALPCRSPPAGEETGEEEGSSRPGRLGDQPAGPAEVAALPAAGDGGTDHPEHSPR